MKNLKFAVVSGRNDVDETEPPAAWLLNFSPTILGFDNLVINGVDLYGGTRHCSVVAFRDGYPLEKIRQRYFSFPEVNCSTCLNRPMDQPGDLQNVRFINEQLYTQG